MLVLVLSASRCSCGGQQSLRCGGDEGNGKVVEVFHPETNTPKIRVPMMAPRSWGCLLTLIVTGRLGLPANPNHDWRANPLTLAQWLRLPANPINC